MVLNKIINLLTIAFIVVFIIGKTNASKYSTNYMKSREDLTVLGFSLTHL